MECLEYLEFRVVSGERRAVSGETRQKTKVTRQKLKPRLKSLIISKSLSLR